MQERIQKSTCGLDLVADVIAHIGDMHFWPALARWVEDSLGSGSPIIYRFNGKHRPEVLYHPFFGQEAEIQVDRYLTGLYLLDPFVDATLRCIPSGAYALKELAPDKFQQTQYFREFYRHANIGDEICVMSRLEGSDSYVVISIARYSGQRPFTRRDLQAVKRTEKFLNVVIRKHLMQGRPAADGATSLAYRTVEDFGYPVLTHREREIAALILRGHSSKSAAAHLHISAETVRNHRKRLYAKLGVASQSQLFLKFIGEVLGSPNPAGTDPDRTISAPRTVVDST